MVLADNPFYFQCLGRLWASPEDVPFPAFGWAGGPHCLSPIVLQYNALRVLCKAFCSKLALSQGIKRSHTSLVYAGSEISNAYPETHLAGSCCCSYGGVSIGHSLHPGSVFQYSTPACGWPPMPTGEPLWPPGGPHHVAHLFSRTWIGIPVGRWARGVWCSPPLVLLQHDSAPTCACGSLGRTGCPGWSLPSISEPGNLLSKYTSW